MFKEIRIDGTDTGYRVSEDGTVIGQRGTPLKPQNNRGYKFVVICFRGKQYRRMIHRLVAEAFLPNVDPERLTVVGFLNGDKSDVRAKNLRWVVAPSPMGEMNERTVYTDDEVRRCCELISSGKYTPDEIRRETGIKYTTVREIWMQGTRKNITTHYHFPPYPKSSLRGKAKLPVYKPPTPPRQHEPAPSKSTRRMEEQEVEKGSGVTVSFSGFSCGLNGNFICEYDNGEYYVTYQTGSSTQPKAETKVFATFSEMMELVKQTISRDYSQFQDIISERIVEIMRKAGFPT